MTCQDALVNFTVCPLPDDLRDKPVEFFWCHNTGWKRELIHQFLLDLVLLVLYQRHQLCLVEEGAGIGPNGLSQSPTTSLLPPYVD